MDEKEKERRWKEMVDNGRIGWKEELVSDLKLLVILLVFWISFVCIIELVGA